MESELDEKRIAALKAVYDQVCDAHNGIADFRGKLLTLLPIASGVGIFSLVKEGLPLKAIDHFLGLGIFSAVIVFGLFIFDLVGIHRCRTLRVYGCALEKKLLPADSPKGRFTLEREKFVRFVSITAASLTIYPAVIAAWSYVACLGAMKFCPCKFGALEISALVFLAFFIMGKIVRQRQDKLLEGVGKEDGDIN
jgi:hypothetical protein